MNRDAVLHAPAAERNKEPILGVLTRLLPAGGRVLEVASGTGQHVEWFAAALPGLEWQPSDPNAAHRASIAARVAKAGLGNVRPPIDLDVFGAWPELEVDAVIVANLLHVSPPGAIGALCAGAAGVLRGGGLLQVYGPFNRQGRYTSESNAGFDHSLRQQNPEWGVRDLEVLQSAGEAHGLMTVEIVEMPANNLVVVMRNGGRATAAGGTRP